MKIIVTFLSLLLLIVSFGAVKQQHGGDVCGFTLQGEPTHPTVTGPDDVVSVVYVVEQPDSPVAVVSVDLQGMRLSVSNEQYTERDCAKYKIRNRRNWPVQRFGIELMVTSVRGAGGGFGAQSSSPLASGQTVEIQSCDINGHGEAPENYVRLLVYIHSVDFRDRS